MKEELVSFELSRLAKDSGFDVPCPAGYDDEGQHWYRCGKHYSNKEPFVYKTQSYHTLAPTTHVLAKWFREKYGLYVYIDWYMMEGVIVDGEVELFRKCLDEIYTGKDDYLNLLLIEAFNYV